MRFSSDEQRKAMFAHMQHPTVARSTYLRGKRKEFKRGSRVGAAGLALGLVALKTGRPLARFGYRLGVIRAVGYVGGKAVGGISKGMEKLYKFKLKRVIRRPSTIADEASGFYIAKKRFKRGHTFIDPGYAR